MSAPPPATAIRSGQILGWLRAREGEIAALIEWLAAVETPSHDAGAHGPAFALLGAALRQAGFTVRHLPGRRTGGQLLAVPARRPRGRPVQLVVGHVDTVWPLGTLAAMPLTRRAGRLFGPGVHDTKGGLAQVVFALAALHALRLEPEVVPAFFVNSDEEIGSPESVRALRRLAARANRVFVVEPPLGVAGRLKTTRKGVTRFTVRVIGRAAHAGLAPERGASAILELSRVVQHLFGLNDPSRGITVNVGTIQGGLRPNVVAPESRAEVEVRALRAIDARRTEEAIRRLTPSLAGTRIVVEGGDGRPPMEPTAGSRELWRRAARAAAELGLTLEEGSAGGASDGNLTSRLAPTLDGLGAVGDGAHAPDEHVLLGALPERAALLAALLLDPALEALPPAAAVTGG